jgi:hypothetical protein
MDGGPSGTYTWTVRNTNIFLTSQDSVASVCLILSIVDRLGLERQIVCKSFSNSSNTTLDARLAIGFQVWVV